MSAPHNVNRESDLGGVGVARRMSIWGGAFIIYGLALHVAAQPSLPTENERTLAAFTSIGELRPILEDIRSEIDRTQFDRESLLEALEYKSEKILSFVRNRIRFEAYTGLLRGPHGTLISRAGNALDQAVLLASLLRDAGYDVRIAEGEISQGDASRLVRGMSAQQTSETVFKDEQRVVALSAHLKSTSLKMTQGERPSSSLPNDDLSKAREIASLLVREITQSGEALGRGAVNWQDLVGSARTYYWVQYRDNLSGPWIDVHPAFGSQNEPVASETRYFADQVPQDLLHKVRVQAFISQRLGERLLEKEVMSPWERPVANLVGMTVRYANFPDGILAVEGSDEMAFRAAIRRSHFFHPLLNNGLAPGGKAFGLDGNAVPPDVAASYMAGLFQNLGSKMGAATGALSSGGESKEEFMSIVAHWLEIDLISPDNQTRKMRRDLLKENDESDDHPFALAREVAITLEPGHTSLALYVDTLLQQLITSVQVLQIIADARPGAPVEIDQSTIDSVIELSAGAVNRDYLVGSSSLSAAISASHVYRPRAAIVATYRPVLGLSTPGAGATGFDILSDFNFVWTDLEAYSGALPVTSTEKTIHLGVLQTMLESYAQFPARSAGNNAFRDWDVSGSRPLVVRHAPNVLRVKPSSNSVNSKEIFWRIDPRTGETIGVNGEGWGGQVVALLPVYIDVPEYLVPLVTLLSKTYGTAKVTRALTVCGGILATVKMFSITQTSGGLVESLPPSVAVVLAGIGVGLHLFSMAGGDEAFMEACLRKMVVG